LRPKGEACGALKGPLAVCKCILDAIKAQKMHLVAANAVLVLVSRFDLAEPLDATGGTLRFRRTPVE